ncbi:hypothetical protein DPX16_4765 [Anabarilius grahami]|uniref:Sleeping Beauty transposase HTH domain-containing protein n=1 Tax=Anabarilius grahami TaxID=495550 RepID=A0A3N0YJ83_ANAGA|nr:hypothetical protein DPX16_4765 [Anabarilius grahami]
MIQNQFLSKYVTSQCSKLSPYLSPIHNDAAKHAQGVTSDVAATLLQLISQQASDSRRPPADLHPSRGPSSPLSATPPPASSCAPSPAAGLATAATETQFTQDQDLRNGNTWKRNVLRKKIISLHHKGEGYKKISKALFISQNTVAKVVQKFKKDGTATISQRRPGRPRKLTPRQERLLMRRDEENRHASSLQLSKEVESQTGVTISRDTIRRTLQRNGMPDIRTPTPTPNTVRGRKPEVTLIREGKKEATGISEAQQRDKSEKTTIGVKERGDNTTSIEESCLEDATCVCVCVCVHMYVETGIEGPVEPKERRKIHFAVPATEPTQLDPRQVEMLPPSLWNQLPRDIRLAPSITFFKSKLKTTTF